MLWKRFCLTFVAMLVLALAGPGEAQKLTAEPTAGTKARVQEAFGKLPLYFVENHGQVDGPVAYYVQGRDTTVYFTPEGLTIALTRAATGSPASQAGGPQSLARPAALRTDADSKDARKRWAVKLDFVGANPEARPRGQDATPAVFSYFKGPREQWKAGLSTYASVVYPDLWPGIDLVFTGTANRLKYTFRLQPGADPDRIKLAYRGATAVRLTGAGELDVSTPVGGFSDAKPYAYQEVEGRRVDVAAAYALDREALAGVQGYGFSLGSYDRGKPLVLDPAILVYAGYIGGAGEDRGHGIAVDSAGNAYVTGFTLSSEATFPATVGPDLTYNGSFDAFVAKVNAAGTALLYAGYIGGAQFDGGSGIAVDSAGNAYVTGFTFSSEATFPVTVGPDLTHNGGSGDAFVAKVNAAGTALLYAGYIGGDNFDEGDGIAVDGAGNAYVTGLTFSSEATFPVTVGPDLTHNGGEDAFVAKVNALGTALLYAGYIGGDNLDWGAGIAVDGAGNAYVTGIATSSETSFPVTVGPDLTFNGHQDAFVTKVNAAGTALLYAGYIGGAARDWGLGIAVDSGGNAYVTGITDSAETTFPVTVGPDVTYNGNTDVFVAKVNAAGTGLLYAGYIGGTGGEGLEIAVEGPGVEGPSIAVDSAGNAYVASSTTSSEATFPVTRGPDLTFNGGSDAFVAKVNAAGTALVYAGYIGGADTELGTGIAVDSAGNAYVVGLTDSSQATFPVTVGPDLTFNGVFDAFVAKIADVPDVALEAVVLIIDEDSIDNGTPPNFFSLLDVNDDVAEIGVRAQLRFFRDNPGTMITLYTGEVGDEGWHALKDVPDSWTAAGGLPGYIGNPAAFPEDPPPHGTGPGLGAPDANGDRESLLDNIPNVTPLRATGLKNLEGRDVCAVVYDNNVAIGYNPLRGSLKGGQPGHRGLQGPDGNPAHRTLFLIAPQGGHPDSERHRGLPEAAGAAHRRRGAAAELLLGALRRGAVS